MVTVGSGESLIRTRDDGNARSIVKLYPDKLTVQGVLAIQRNGEPIHPRDWQLMFDFAGVDRERFLNALRAMGQAFLPGKLREAWTPANPTRNYCYVIAEWVWHWHAPVDAVSYSLEVDDPAIGDTKHYFVRWPDGRPVDLAAGQFADYYKVDYRNGKKQRFRTVAPSMRARRLAELYGDSTYYTRAVQVDEISAHHNLPA